MNSRNMTEKAKEVLEDLISDYIEDLDLYDAGFRNPLLDKKRKLEILSNMEETAYKLHIACADLRKEIK
jgi:hypothetical protein